ncbi:hypothetical protein J8G26_07160 [Acidovorax sp. JG5]|jgi:hypothetical protein|uniref:hypothetical protein n=1 Tax=Acidovorax sp. JG5 TaxID=2822718 RepID=UPI001B31D55D|nr:hypothetical protein [Acidovorax sp. JG5]MBP3980512.1 hypothetical protein [Acidovorax sp. JG5]
MRLNLSDAVDDLAPPPPPCFFNRASWIAYLKSAAAAQNHNGSQPVIIVAADGEPAFNARLNYCADCTQAKSLEMQDKGRCNPYHLSDDPERVPAGGWQARDEAAPQCTKTQRPQDLPVSSAMRWQDAFDRLVTHLLAQGARTV